MWKNPNRIAAVFARFAVQLLLKQGQQHSLSSFPEPIDYGAYGEFCTAPFSAESYWAYQKVAEAYNELVGLLSFAGSNERDLEQLLSKRLLAVAEEIERHKDWEKVQGLFDVPTLISPDPTTDNPANFTFTTLYAFAVRWLVGTEERHLVGTRRGQALWIPYALSRDATMETVLNLFPVDSAMRYLDRSDLNILPKPGKWIVPRPLGVSLPTDGDGATWAAINDLFEDAYYNQHYLMHPEGSLVRVTNIPGLDSVVLKAKRGIYDRNYLDFLGIFLYEDGQRAVVAMNGELAVSPTDNGDKIIRVGTSGTRLAHLLIIAQIYHDLVTKIELGSSPKVRSGEGVSTASDSPKAPLKLEWTLIPRISHRKTLEPRLPIPNSRSMQPHRVSGHRRKANMTDRQRDAIRDLEQETGIEILKWIPEGYTFVRPHISPVGDSQAIQSLPRFIRRRIQSDIEKLLTDSEP